MKNTLENTEDQHQHIEQENLNPEVLFREAEALVQEAEKLEQEAATLEMPVLTEAVTDGIVVDIVANNETAPAEARNEAEAYSLATKLAPSRAKTVLKWVATLIASLSAAVALDAAVSQASYAQSGGFPWEKIVRVVDRGVSGAERVAQYTKQIKDLEAEKIRLTGEYREIMVKLGIGSTTESMAGSIEKQYNYQADMADLEVEEGRLEAAFADKSNPTHGDSLRYKADKKTIEAKKLRLAARRGVGISHHGDATSVEDASKKGGRRVSSSAPSHQGEIEVGDMEETTVSYTGTGDVRQAGRALERTAEIEARRVQLEARLAGIDNEIQRLQLEQKAEAARSGVGIIGEIGR